MSDDGDLLTPDALAASLYRQAHSNEAWQLLRPEDAMLSPVVDEARQRLEHQCQQHLYEIERLKRYIGFDPAEYQVSTLRNSLDCSLLTLRSAVLARVFTTDKQSTQSPYRCAGDAAADAGGRSIAAHGGSSRMMLF